MRQARVPHAGPNRFRSKGYDLSPDCLETPLATRWIVAKWARCSTGVLFDETRKTLFCSDLFHHFGDVEAVTSSDLIELTRRAMQ